MIRDRLSDPDFNAMADALVVTAARLGALGAAPSAGQTPTVVRDGQLLLRVGDVAERLALSRTKVWGLISKGDIPVLRIGRSVRVPSAALAEWVDQKVMEIQPLQVPIRTSVSGDAIPSTAPRTRVAALRAKPSGVVPPPSPGAHRAPQKPTRHNEPFYESWMPRPMQHQEYQAWIHELERDPDAYADVLWKMEEDDAKKSGKRPMVTREEYRRLACDNIERRRHEAEERAKSRTRKETDGDPSRLPKPDDSDDLGLMHKPPAAAHT